MKTLTASRLRELLAYNCLTGQFVWRVDRGFNTRRGEAAGTPIPHGYVKICVDGVGYGAHRLAWLYTTGEWPPEEIDHRDTDPSNNRFLNLRCATRSQNNQNMRVRCNSESGRKGVMRHARNHPRPYIAHIQGDYLGRFASADAANAAYEAATLARYREFARAA